jgi:hypothetical protein
VVGVGVEDAAVPPDGMVQQSALVFLQAEGKLVVHGYAFSILNEKVIKCPRFFWATQAGSSGRPGIRCLHRWSGAVAAQSGLL